MVATWRPRWASGQHGWIRLPELKQHRGKQSVGTECSPAVYPESRLGNLSNESAGLICAVTSTGPEVAGDSPHKLLSLIRPHLKRLRSQIAPLISSRRNAVRAPRLCPGSCSSRSAWRRSSVKWGTPVWSCCVGESDHRRSNNGLTWRRALIGKTAVSSGNNCKLHPSMLMGMLLIKCNYLL